MNKKLLTCLLVLSLSLTTACSLPFSKQKDTEEQVAETITAQSEYNVGDTILATDVIKPNPNKEVTKIGFSIDGSILDSYTVTQEGSTDIVCVVQYSDDTVWQDTLHFAIPSASVEVSTDVASQFAAADKRKILRNNEDTMSVCIGSKYVMTDNKYTVESGIASAYGYSYTSDLYNVTVTVFPTSETTDIKNIIKSSSTIAAELKAMFAPDKLGVTNNLTEDDLNDFYNSVFEEPTDSNSAIKFKDINGNDVATSVYKQKINYGKFFGNSNSVEVATCVKVNNWLVSISATPITETPTLTFGTGSTPVTELNVIDDYTKCIQTSFTEEEIAKFQQALTSMTLSEDAFNTILTDVVTTQLFIGDWSLVEGQVTEEVGSTDDTTSGVDIEEGVAEYASATGDKTYAELHPDLYKYPETQRGFRRWQTVITDFDSEGPKESWVGGYFPYGLNGVDVSAYFYTVGQLSSETAADYAYLGQNAAEAAENAEAKTTVEISSTASDKTYVIDLSSNSSLSNFKLIRQGTTGCSVVDQTTNNEYEVSIVSPNDADTYTTAYAGTILAVQPVTKTVPIKGTPYTNSTINYENYYLLYNSEKYDYVGIGTNSDDPNIRILIKYVGAEKEAYSGINIQQIESCITAK